MQRLEVSGAVRPLYESLGFKELNKVDLLLFCHFDAIFKSLNYFYRHVVGFDCKSEYKIKRL